MFCLCHNSPLVNLEWRSFSNLWWNVFKKTSKSRYRQFLFVCSMIWMTDNDHQFSPCGLLWLPPTTIARRVNHILHSRHWCQWVLHVLVTHQRCTPPFAPWHQRLAPTQRRWTLKTQHLEEKRTIVDTSCRQHGIDHTGLHLFGQEMWLSHQCIRSFALLCPAGAYTCTQDKHTERPSSPCVIRYYVRLRCARD